MQLLDAFLKPLALATGSIVSAMTIGVAPAAAATVTYDFGISVNSGLFAGQTFSGALSFNDTSVTGVGEEHLTIETLSLEFFDTTYTEADLEDILEADLADILPDVRFLDGKFLGISSSDSNYDLSEIAEIAFEIAGNSFFYETPDLGSGSGAVSYTLREEGDVAEAPVSTPEPSGVLALGLVSGAIARRRFT